MRRRLIAAIFLAVVGASAVAAVAPPATPAQPASPPCATAVASWVAGTVDLCEGTLVYRDYVYDDYGANTNNPNASTTGSLARPTGDQRYEKDVNSADLVDLELRVVGDRLHVTFELSSLFTPDSTVAAIAIDTDGTGPAREWPGLGIRSAGWDVFAPFDQGDPATNIIEGSLPLPAGSRWRVQAATAVKGGPVMNVAFRGPAETGTWMEDAQAAALETGDVSAFGHEVEVADFVGRINRPTPLAPGYFERVYRSDHTIPPGEGVDYEGKVGRNGVDGFSGDAFSQRFHFLGRYQPYSVYVPEGPGPHGMHLALHGYAGSHAGLGDGMRQQLGEDLDRILVVPLGRGPAGFYSDWSERDVLDVIDDVERTYPIDKSRVFAGGYSMGGYGTLRFATLYPDRFAGYTNWVGFTGDCLNGTPIVDRCSIGAVGNPVHFVGNLRWVPGANLYAAADELVWLWTGAGLNQAMADAGVPYVYYLHPAAEHLTLAVLDQWQKEANYTKDLRLVTNPPRVSFRTDLSLGNPDLGIMHDRAYWVSAIRNRAEGIADVDVTTHACGGALNVVESQPGAGIAPVPWVSQAGVITGQQPLERADRLEGNFINLASATIDAGRACLAGKAFAYKLTTDGPVTLTFGDGRALALPAAGTHEGMLPAPAEPSTQVLGQEQSRADGATLPATGTSPGPWGLGTALAALGLVAVSRRTRDRHCRIWNT